MELAQRKSLVKQCENVKKRLLSVNPTIPSGQPINWEDVMKDQDRALHRLKYHFAGEVVALEQKGLQNVVRIFNVPECEMEDTKQRVLQLFQEKLFLTMSEKDIDVSYRTGVAWPGIPRPILVVFTNNRARLIVMNRKKLLHMAGFGIEKELCPQLLKIKREATRIFGARNVKIGNCTIEVTTPEGEHENFQTLMMFRKFLEERDLRLNNFNLHDN